ncbi:MAG: DnaB-like helicase C-terminal domain-containing protein [Alphaproteobacteria bacterium]
MTDASTTEAIPLNLEAEQALLGIILYDNSACEAVGATLAPRHFYEPVHQRVFTLIKADIEKGQRPEAYLLATRMRDDPAFMELGGATYLADLIDNAPPTYTAPDYARAIFDAALRRDVLRVCDAGTAEIKRNVEAPAFDLIADLRRELEAVERDAAPEDATMIDAPEAATQAIAAMNERAVHGKAKGCMTGLRCIDYRLNGLKPGALIVIGGRPGMGKTALARAIAHGAAVRNPDKLIAFMGIEMGPEEMMQRELSALSFEVGREPVEYRAMGSGSLTHFDFDAISEASRHVPANLILDDCTTLSVEDVRRKVWSLKRRGKIGAIVIDYLQLMRRPSAQGRNEASVLGEMTSTLKQIARQAQICIVLLSQLSRAVESRDDKRPMMSDLRESGSIEQDADVVLFPYREFYYLSKSEPRKAADKIDWEMKVEDLRRVLEVACAKQRQGPTGTDLQEYYAEFDAIRDVRPER